MINLHKKAQKTVIFTFVPLYDSTESSKTNQAYTLLLAKDGLIFCASTL